MPQHIHNKAIEAMFLDARRMNYFDKGPVINSGDRRGGATKWKGGGTGQVLPLQKEGEV